MLSSSEAEQVTLSEADKEVLFMPQLLRSIKISVKLPVTVKIDNIGAILVASNISDMSHIKHIDIRYKYVNEYVEDGVVRLFLLSLLKTTEKYNN